MGTHTHNFRAEAEHTMLEVYSIIIYVVQYGKSKDIINFSVSEIFASVFLLLLLLPLHCFFAEPPHSYSVLRHKIEVKDINLNKSL